jgi:2-methylisocitrate lyase-like PEP mutase family enzyme
MTTQAEKAELLRALHVPGDPLILTNVWDAVTARIVAGAPGLWANAYLGAGGDAVTRLSARGEYPPELDFEY